jgi:hypothetical protein
MPGHEAIERFLNRGAAPPANPRWRVAYRDRYVARDGSVFPDSGRAGDGIPVFAIRCAVVSRPELHAYVSMLGAHHIASMNVFSSAGSPR